MKDDVLRFEQDGKPGAEIKLASIQGVFLGEESKQVGGVPANLGKAAVPFGGGRAVSLFSHKKYDTVTLEYRDEDEGVHGAIFQLSKGQGELVRNELGKRGVMPGSGRDQTGQGSTAEVSHEDK